MTLMLAEIPPEDPLVRERFTTESGSVYEIDDVNKTWTRVSKSPLSGGIRSETGVFDYRTGIAVGDKVRFVCPPFDAAKSGASRIIVTSAVVSVGGVR